MWISRTLGAAHGTVRRFVAAPEFPGRAPHRRQPSILDPYLDHLARRHAEERENATQLWRETRALGYAGTAKQERRWLQDRRRQQAPTAPRQYRRALAASGSPTAVSLPSPKQLAWLLVQRPDDLPAADAWLLQHIAQDAETAKVLALVQRFVMLVRARTTGPPMMEAALDQLLADARTCGVRAVESFARGLAQDMAAVRAGLTTL